jgi:hypothetical protein
MPNLSACSTQPENSSFLQANKFTFSFATLPFLKYFCQTVNIPGVSTSPVTVDNPFSNTYRHGDKLLYDQMNITIIVDEDMRVWEETYNWLQALTFPKEFRQYFRNTNGRQTAYHDGILTINTNANNPNMRFQFYNCHPSSLGGINFSVQSTAQEVITCDITFRYDSYEIVRI